MRKILILTLLATACAQAPKLEKTKLDLKLDATWKCDQVQTEMVCRPTASPKKTTQVIVWTAKQKGQSDSLQNYKANLANARKGDFQGKQITSVPKYTKVIKINGQDWVDSVHWQSEVPNYFTRYLATVDEKTAVLITFSGHKDVFDQFNGEIQPTVDQLLLAK